MKSDLFHEVARAYYGISPELYALSQKYAAKSTPSLFSSKLTKSIGEHSNSVHSLLQSAHAISPEFGNAMHKSISNNDLLDNPHIHDIIDSIHSVRHKTAPIGHASESQFQNFDKQFDSLLGNVGIRKVFPSVGSHEHMGPGGMQNHALAKVVNPDPKTGRIGSGHITSVKRPALLHDASGEYVSPSHVELHPQHDPFQKYAIAENYATEAEEGKAAASPKKTDSKRSSKKTDSKTVNPNFPPPKKQPKSSPGQMNLPFGSGAPKPDTNVTQPAKKKSSAEILSEIGERERREQKSQKEIPGLEGSHNEFAAARRKESLGYEPDEDVLSMLDDDSLGVQRLSSKAFAAQDSIANDETANKAQQMHADAMDAHESMAESFRDDAWSYGADLNEISELDPDDWEDLPEDAREALEIAMHHDLMAEKHAAYMRENEKKYPTPVRAPKTPYALGDAQFTGTGEPAEYGLADQGYGQKGVTWNLGSGEYAVEGEGGGASLFHTGEDYPRTSKKIKDLSPEEFQSKLVQDKPRRQRLRSPVTPYALGDAQVTGTGEPAPYAIPDAKAKAKRWKRPRGKKGKLPEKNCATACK